MERSGKLERTRPVKYSSRHKTSRSGCAERGRHAQTGRQIYDERLIVHVLVAPEIEKDRSSFNRVSAHFYRVPPRGLFVCLFVCFLRALTALNMISVLPYCTGFSWVSQSFTAFFLSRIFSVLNPTITLMDGADSRRK